MTVKHLLVVNHHACISVWPQQIRTTSQPKKGGWTFRLLLSGVNYLLFITGAACKALSSSSRSSREDEVCEGFFFLLILGWFQSDWRSPLPSLMQMRGFKVSPAPPRPQQQQPAYITMRAVVTAVSLAESLYNVRRVSAASRCALRGQGGSGSSSSIIIFTAVLICLWLNVSHGSDRLVAVQSHSCLRTVMVHMHAKLMHPRVLPPLYHTATY